jgi:AcrR family transcriptional regulator
MLSVTTPPAQPRSYDSSRRRAAAARNRRAVLDACHALLLRDGYQATTIRAVADRAGVSADMIYKTFGSKQQLMKAVYDVVIAGDDEPIPIAQRPAVQQVLGTADAQEKVRLYARFVRDYAERLGGLIPVLAEADPEVAEVRATTEDERLVGVRAFVEHLAAQGLLRSGTDEREAADACWVLTSPQLFTQLTHARQWNADTYERWLAHMLKSTLLDQQWLSA